MNIRHIDSDPQIIDPEIISDWFFVTKHDQQSWVLMECPTDFDYVRKNCCYVPDGVKIRFCIGDYGESANAENVLRDFRPDVIEDLIFCDDDVIIPWDLFWEELIDPNIDFIMHLYEDNDVPNALVENRWKNETPLEDYYDKWWYEKNEYSLKWAKYLKDNKN